MNCLQDVWRIKVGDGTAFIRYGGLETNILVKNPVA